jgi:hypothetical protein
MQEVFVLKMISYSHGGRRRSLKNNRCAVQESGITLLFLPDITSHSHHPPILS